MRELINVLVLWMEWATDHPGEFIVLGLMVMIILGTAIAGLKDIKRRPARPPEWQ